MAVTEEERLRAYLGESIPAGGAASDTLFTVDQIDDLLERHGSPEGARREGLELKAAALANLVTTVEGSSTRKLSDAHRAVLAQIKTLGPSGSTRTRIHRIQRDR
jgi:hypothetical protein